MAVSPQDIKSTQFARAKRGLDPAQVAEFLEQVAAALAVRDRKLHEARTEIAALTRAVAEVKRSEEAFRLTMNAATEAKDEMLRAASDEAAQLVAEARAEASNRISAAEDEVALLQAEKARLQRELAEMHTMAPNPHLDPAVEPATTSTFVSILRELSA